MKNYIDTLMMIKTDTMSAQDRALTLNHFLVCYKVSLSDLTRDVLMSGNKTAKAALIVLLG